MKNVISVVMQLPIYRLSMAQYHAMAESGILRSGEKVELLEGYLVQKVTRSPPHATTISLLDAELTSRLSADWMVRTQMPITLTDSEPEPDAAVVPEVADFYMHAHPRPPAIALVVEVAHTTVEQNRGDKKRVYARGKIPIYWLVNIPEAQIEVYTQPRGGRNPTYRQRRDYLFTEMIPLVIAGQEVSSIAVRDLLPFYLRSENRT